MVARKRRAQASLRESAAALSDIRALRVRLENGERVEFDLSRELAVPTDPDELLQEARKAPAQVAFWSYQAERGLERVRKAESLLARKEAHQYLVYRRWYETEECVDPTEAMLRARLDQDWELRKFRVALRARRKEYGDLRAARDAVDLRARMMRTLLGRYEP